MAAPQFFVICLVLGAASAHEGAELNVSRIFAAGAWASAEQDVQFDLLYNYPGETFMLCNKSFTLSGRSTDISAGAHKTLGSPAQAAKSPSVQIQPPAVRESASFTLLMVDPDVPFSTVGNITHPLVHWLITNIPNGDHSLGASHVAYGGPRPLMGSGQHRYIFLLLQQTHTIDTTTQYAGSNCSSRLVGRCLFDVNRFATEEQLQLRAQAYFYASNDEWTNQGYFQAERECDFCPWLPQCSSAAYVTSSLIVMLLSVAVSFMH